MHTLYPLKNLLTIALLGLVAIAVMTSSLRVKKVAYGNSTVPEALKDLTAQRMSVQGPYAGAWEALKSKSECQIIDNDKKIVKFKTQRVRAGTTFSAIYDRRVAELERRNTAIKGKLNDYKGERGEPQAEFK